MFAPFLGIVHHLLCECLIGFGHLSLRVMGEDAFPLSGDLGSPDRPWDVSAVYLEIVAV